MSLTAEEIIQIEELAKVNPLVKRMLDELQLIEQDAGAKLYKSLVEAVNALSAEVDATHTGKYSQYKILKGDPKTFKRIFQLLTKSKSIVNGLVAAKKLVVGKQKPVKIKIIKEKSNTEPEEMPEENLEMSFADRSAMKQKEKLNGTGK